MHPTNPATLIVGKGALYRTTNSGTSWSALGATSGGNGNIVAIAYAPSNPSVIYAAKYNRMFVSTNGGTSFTDITGTLPVASASITYIAVSSTDANRVYVTFSGYSSANKVFTSANAGTSWTNISSGLPNLPVNCIVYQTGTADGIYVGTDVGVYYRDNGVPMELHPDPAYRGIGDWYWVMAMVERGLRMAALPRFTSVFANTGENLCLKPNVLRERKEKWRKTPAWIKPLKPAIIAWTRWRILLRQPLPLKPFDYSLYTLANMEARVTRRAAKPTSFWPGR